jgi:hypothetical protein
MLILSREQVKIFLIEVRRVRGRFQCVHIVLCEAKPTGVLEHYREGETNCFSPFLA